MALDFSNRNPEDPNGIYSLDTANSLAGWVKDKDWSQVYYTEAEARKNGATNKISVATAITNDGRKYDVIVGADGKPISELGDTKGQDDDVANKWKQKQAAAAPPGGQTTRTINGQVMQWNPQTRAYDIPTNQTPVTSGSSTPKPSGGKETIEGTPDPSKPGGWDNTRPRRVIRDASGKEVWAEELTGADLEAWRKQQEITRNGGKTDAQIKDEKDAEDKTVVDVSYTGTGKGRKKVTTYKSGRKVTEDAPTNATAVKTEYGPDGTKTVTYDDGTTTTEAPSPAETRAAGKDDFPTEPAGAPALDMTPGRVAQGLQTYSAWLATQVKLHRDTNGAQGISPQNATKLMDRRIAIAETAGRESGNLASQQQGILNSQISQRGQTLVETASRRGDANTAYNNNLARFLPQMTMATPGGENAMAAGLMASLRLNQAYVDQWGGFREAPPVETPTFLGQIRNASMQGIQTAASGGPVLTGAAGAPPKPPPSAAELEAQRQATMAQNQAAMAAAQSGGAPTAGEPGGPPLAPGPVYGDPPPPPMVSPINNQPIQAPPVPNYRPDATTDPAVTPGPVLLPPPPPDAPAPAAPSAPAGPTPPERMVTITHKATGQRRTIPYSEWVTTYRTTQNQWDAVEDNAPSQLPPNEVTMAPPSFLPRPTDGQASIYLDERAMARASQPTPGLDPGAAAFYGHTPENPMMPPGGMRPSFLSQARYGQPYDPRARGLALGIRPDILELALAG